MSETTGATAHDQAGARSDAAPGPSSVERRLADAVRASGAAFVSIDDQGLIRAWNEQAEVLFGWAGAEVLGLPLHDVIIPPVLREGHVRGMARLVRRAPGDRDDSQVLGHRLELPALHRDGREVPVELSAWSHADGSGFSAFIHDISDRRRALAELELARDAAMESSRHKTRFLTNMSHELRTPLNGVIGTTSLLLTTDLDERQRHLAATALNSAEALLTVLDDVLDFSVLEQGALPVELGDVDLRRVVEESAQLLQARAQEKGLRLTCTVDASVPALVRGDPRRLRQVLLNLLGNAVKFTDAGEVAVTAVVTGTAPGRVRVHLAVRDTGQGIDPQAIEPLFDAFAQGDGSTTRRHGGTGLGLAISRRLVEHMGGTLTASSAPGAGSVFVAQLGFDVVAVAAPATPALRADPAPTAATAPPRAAGQDRPRLLLAEDVPVNQLVAVQMLALLGYEVDVVEDGAQAVAAHSAAVYEAILMDCQMPVMDGYEATRRIREAEPDGVHVPIIALTASALPQDRERCLASGMDDHVAKPVRRAHLGEVLRAWTGEGPAVPPVPAQATPPDGETSPRHAVEQAVAQVRARLAELFDDVDPLDLEMRDHLLASFATRAPGYLEAIGTGIAHQDAAEVARQAHSLKGMAGNLGADALALRSEQLEHLARSGSLGGAQALLAGLHSDLGHTSAALERLGAPAPTAG